jgi:hypothetical protein
MHDIVERMIVWFLYAKSALLFAVMHNVSDFAIDRYIISFLHIRCNHIYFAQTTIYIYNSDTGVLGSDVSVLSQALASVGGIEGWMVVGE